MEEQNKIETIIMHYLQETISEEEMKMLTAWMHESEENRNLFFQLKNLYDARKGGLYPTEEEIRQSKERLLSKLRKTSGTDPGNGSAIGTKNRSLIAFYKYAAVAIIFVCLTLGIQKVFEPKELPIYTELDIESGPRMSHLTLPDGTKVVLNASSKFRFPDKFENNIREVFLDGEAFFDVVPNKKAPFVVTTSRQKVSVLGTCFNMMDYSVDDYAITTLVSGSIKLQSFKDTGELNEEIVMKPNQQVFFNKTNNLFALSSVKVDLSRTWINKMYHFRNEPLLQITKHLEKIYGIKIDIVTDEIKDMRCTGTFALNQEIEDVLKIINYDKQFSYTIDKDIITIR